MKTLRNYGRFIAVFAGMLFFTACIEKEEEPILSVSPSKLTFTAEETGEQSVSINTDASDWNYIGAADWIVNVRKDNKRLYFKVEKHEKTNGPRSETFTIIAGKKKKTSADVTIEQLAKINSLEASPNNLSFEYNESGSKTVSITTDASSWDCTATANWISLSKQDKTLTVKASETNNGIEERSADLVVTAGNASPVTIHVKQDAQDSLNFSLPELIFGANETSSKEVSITTNASAWDFKTQDGSWLTISKSGNNLNIKPVSQNTSTSSRIATVSITAGTASAKTIKVTQEGRNTLTVSPSELIFAANETSNYQSVDITTNASSWNYSSPASWLTISKSGNRLSIRPATQNESEISREANIVVTAGTATERFIKVTQNGQSKHTLTVSVTSLAFGATETINKSVTVTTNAPSWDATSSVSWLTISKSGNMLVIRPTTQNTTAANRSSTIRVTAGTALEQTITVIHYAQPVYSNVSYRATGTPLEDNPPYNNSAWTGQILSVNTDNPPYIAVRAWGATSGPTFYFEYVNGGYRLDKTTRVANDGNYDGYLCWASYNSSTKTVTYDPDYNPTFTYNTTTKVLDFSGIMNGYPRCLMVVGKNRNTGDWVDGFFYNIYLNVKLEITSTLSTPLQGGSEQVSTNAKAIDLDESKSVNDFSKFKSSPNVVKLK